MSSGFIDEELELEKELENEFVLWFLSICDDLFYNA